MVLLDAWIFSKKCSGNFKVDDLDPLVYDSEEYDEYDSEEYDSGECEDDEYNSEKDDTESSRQQDTASVS